MGYTKGKQTEPKKIGDLMGKVGRPPGHKLSQTTKDKISASKKGGFLTVETREKISVGVIEHYRLKNPLSTELLKMYGKVASEWIKTNVEALDAPGCKTLNQMRSQSRTEFPIGRAIEFIVIDDLTPETLVILMEELENETD